MGEALKYTGALRDSWLLVARTYRILERPLERGCLQSHGKVAFDAEIACVACVYS